MRFSFFGCHIESAISNFENCLTEDSYSAILKTRFYQFFFVILCITLDCHFEFSKSDSRFVINDHRNRYFPHFSKKLKFSKFCLSYWIRNFEFFKSDSKFVISEPKNRYIPIFFTKNWEFFQIIYAILDSPF